MAYNLNAGIEVSIDGTTWYKLTDHNRREIEVSPTLIEKEQRMANGTLRKFVISKKDTISTSWDFVPTLGKQNTFAITSATVSGNTIFYVTSSNHNFVLNSLVTVSGFTNNSLNITGKVTNLSTNSFSLTNIEQAADGLTTAPALAKESFSSITTVDENYGASWLTAFYNANYGTPIKIKITASKHNDPTIGQAPIANTYVSSSTGTKTYDVFITNFTKTIRKRSATTDYVDMSIEFTEI